MKKYINKKQYKINTKRNLISPSWIILSNIQHGLWQCNAVGLSCRSEWIILSMKVNLCLLGMFWSKIQFFHVSAVSSILGVGGVHWKEREGERTGGLSGLLQFYLIFKYFELMNPMMWLWIYCMHVMWLWIHCMHACYFS